MTNELLIPEIAESDPNAVEVLHVWVAKGGQHVSISTGIWEDPEAWGIVLADLAGQHCECLRPGDRLRQGADSVQDKKLF